MQATIKVSSTAIVDGKTKKVLYQTEVEVTPDTDEDSLEEVIEAIKSVMSEVQGADNILRYDWNSAEIFRIAERLANA